MKKIKGIQKEYEISQNDCFWNMLCRLDDNIAKLNNDDIKNNRCVYIFWDWEDIPIRIGKAIKGRNRIISYYTNYTSADIWDRMHQEISFVSVIYTKSEHESRNIELDLLQSHKPKYNYHDIA